MNIRILVCAMLLLAPFSWAGSAQKAEAKFEPERIIKFAKNVEKYAAQKGARVFIIARVGRPEKDLPRGIRYTHTAIAVYSDITLDSGELVQGYAIYNLYQEADNPNRSLLKTDYPVDFFWGAQRLKAGIIIPSPDIQTRLIELITQNAHHLLHNKQYSVVANPFNSRYQNCTEHTLDLLNAAIYQTTDIERIKANTKAYFAPQRVKTSRFKLAMGSMFVKGVTTKDHTGPVRTTTFGSIGEYLEQYELLTSNVTFYEDKSVIAD